MKQIIIITISILFIILAYLFQINFLESSSRYLLSDIQAIKNYADLEKYGYLVDSANSLKVTWESVKSGYDIFGEHDDVESINEHIAAIINYANFEEKVELYKELSTLETIIKHITQKEKLSFSNVL